MWAEEQDATGYCISPIRRRVAKPRRLELCNEVIFAREWLAWPAKIYKLHTKGADLKSCRNFF